MKNTILGITLAIVWAIAGQSSAAPPQRLLILTQGPDGHPAATHEYVAGGEILKQTFATVPDLQVETLRVDKTDEPAISAAIAKADGIVLSIAEGAKWLAAEPRRSESFAKHVEHKRGLFVLHWAMGTRTAEPIEPFVQLFGACHGGPDRKYRVLETTVHPREHPTTAGLRPFKIKDEFYYALKTNPKSPPTPLLEIDLDDTRSMVAWAWERPAGGRSAGFSGGHFHANWEREEYRRFIGQTILWTMNLTPPMKDFPPPLTEDVLQLK